MTQLVTASAYAKIRGCSRQAVSQAIAAGRVTLVVGPGGKHLVDVDAANVSWAARTDNAQQQRGAAGQVERTQTLARGSAPSKPDAPTPPPTVDAGLGRTLIEEKTRSEKLRVERQMMELAERRGELVSLAAIRAAWSVKLIAAAEQFQSIADRVSSVFAAETKPEVIHRKLMDEIRHAMELLSVDPGPRPG